jgi:hypothetical protein
VRSTAPRRRESIDSGGVPLGEAFPTPELVRAVEPELAALADAAAGA